MGVSFSPCGDCCSLPLYEKKEMIKKTIKNTYCNRDTWEKRSRSEPARTFLVKQVTEGKRAA